jgi:hypothetical protein
VRKINNADRNAKQKANQDDRCRRALENAPYLWNERAKADTGLDYDELQFGAHGDATMHVTHSATVVRKPARGRLTYVKPNHALLGPYHPVSPASKSALASSAEQPPFHQSKEHIKQRHIDTAC